MVEDKKKVENKEEKKLGKFKMKIKSNILQTVIDSIAVIHNETLFEFKKTKIETTQVDPAHVAMVNMALERDACEEYDSTGIELGIDLDKMKDVLKLAKSDSIVELLFDEKEEFNRMLVKIGHINRRIGILDKEGFTIPKIPDTNYMTMVKLFAGEMNLMLKASEQVSDHIHIDTDKEKFEVWAEGDIDDVHVPIPKAELMELKVPGNETTKSMYSIDVFESLLKTAGSSTELLMEYNSDNPVHLKYDFADGKGKLSYTLAPRIESE